MERQRILVVDDSEFNRKVLCGVLQDEYDTIEATNGREALDIINKNPATISLVLLDILMPEMTGLEVLKTLNDTGISSLIPVILITAADSEEEYGLNLGAVDFITKPFDPNVVKTRVKNHMKIKSTRDMLEELVSFNMDKSELVWEATIEMLANVIEFRSFENFKNCDKIKKITRILIEKLLDDGIYFSEINEIGINFILAAAPLCDIGKIFIPEYILFKNGELTEEEFKIVKKHTINGQKLIDKCLNAVSEQYVKCCREVCLNHHERWDGNGYPNGISGRKIPVSARIVAITDVFDALITGRPYRKAYKPVEAIKMIGEGSGKEFDPIIVDAFIKVADKICKVYQE